MTADSVVSSLSSEATLIREASSSPVFASHTHSYLCVEECVVQHFHNCTKDEKQALASHFLFFCLVLVLCTGCDVTHRNASCLISLESIHQQGTLLFVLSGLQ